MGLEVEFGDFGGGSFGVGVLSDGLLRGLLSVLVLVRLLFAVLVLV